MNNLADKAELTEQDLENESPATQDVVDESFEIEVSDEATETEAKPAKPEKEAADSSDAEIEEYRSVLISLQSSIVTKSALDKKRCNSKRKPFDMHNRLNPRMKSLEKLLSRVKKRL
jgi:hypothetical protein